MNMPDMVSELKRDEGVVLHEYKDSRGFSTIGVGRLIAPPGGISMAEAELLLQHDIAAKSADLDHALPWWRNEPETVQRALLNLTFNLGIAGLLKFHHMLEAIRRQDYDTAAREALDSTWARQTGARAQRVAAQIRGMG